MNAFFHAVEIGTLAIWLSVAGFGTVGVIVPGWRREPVVPKGAETRWVGKDFTLGDEGAEETRETPVESPAKATASPMTALPAPPESPSLAVVEPLPEVPGFPSPAAKPAEAPPQPKPGNRPGSSGGVTRAGTGKPAATGGPGNAKPGDGPPAMSNSARLAAGRMSSPSYPPDSRRNGQTGTVMVEFTVDAGGRVISARAKSSSGWPLLDNEAIRAVRSWSFPPGGVMTLQRPIVFQLR